MKFARFQARGEETIRAGVVVDETIQEINGDIFSEWDYTSRNYSLDQVKLLAPLKPNQVIGIGANYVASKEELPKPIPEIPVFFFKPLSSVVGPEEQIEIPDGIEEVKFESELAVVIGKKVRNISESEVLNAIFGYTIGNDVTAPQFFRQDGHWMVGKSFDTFTPLGPFIETDFDPSTARIQAYQNGEKKQDSTTNLMIVPIPYMISYLSRVMTLMPGDVILTGSPVGAEFLKNNDLIECKIDGIGALQNKAIKVK
jgi:2-keto-4-pentenoate hydratase/2-oxohepta-3-ene-1,7-dioic acid hydratase in catechol pathway